MWHGHSHITLCGNYKANPICKGCLLRRPPVKLVQQMNLLTSPAVFHNDPLIVAFSVSAFFRTMISALFNAFQHFDINRVFHPSPCRDVTECSRPSDDRSHHVWLGDLKAMYSQRYRQVLPFHSPGLAPVVDISRSALYIMADGNPFNEKKYWRAFGFYCGFAAVEDNGEMYHINPSGKPAYLPRWKWCGNFQQHLCVVQDEQRQFYHIDSAGQKKGGPYLYAGDYHEHRAEVRNMAEK